MEVVRNASPIRFVQMRFILDALAAQIVTLKAKHKTNIKNAGSIHTVFK